jgi:hypothetical protein
LITVLAVDPGKASGIALISWSGNQEDLPKLELSFEAQPEQFADNVTTCLTAWKQYEKFAISCERFTINAQTVRNSQAPYSLEQIGVLKHLCRTNGYVPEDISFQTPADAKALFPNEALRKVGTWHRGGEGHALDAIRHALLKLTKLGWKPRVLLE